MKKLILSAVLAVACFTAQAKNEVVSNDDKNPKKSAKIVAKADKKLSLPDVGCKACGFTSAVCNGVATSIGTCQTASTCERAGIKVLIVLAGAGCN